MTANDVEAAIASFIACLTLSPIVGAACKHFRLLDHPGPLKIHNRAVPRLGGVAVAAAIAAGMVVAGHFESRPSFVVAAFCVVWFVGVLDDIRSLTPSVRLFSQIAAAFVLWQAGYGFPNALGEVPSLIGTTIVVVAFVNSWNFVDGADGLAAGLAGIAAIAFFLASDRMQGTAGATLAISVAATCGGFLVWNFAPAKLFMGDAGSTLLGCSIAFFALDFYRSNPASLRVALFPVLVGAIPLIDTALAVVRRLRHARSVVQGDRCHIYDVLLVRGWRARNVALVFFAVTSVLACLSWLALFTNRKIFLVLGAAIVAGVVTAAILLGTVGSKENTANSGARRPEVIGSRSSG